MSLLRKHRISFLQHRRNILMQRVYGSARASRDVKPSDGERSPEMKKAMREIDDITVRLADLHSRPYLERHYSSVTRRVAKATVRPSAPKVTLCVPPGTLWMRVARTIFSSKDVEKYFEPAVADWQSEYFEALQKGSSRTALVFLRLRNTLAIACLFVQFCGLRSIGKLCKLMRSS